ncbi:hypothetical protein FRB93_007597 [Tulasnella sp. JGI-2019a]|nr:hypothetical protein FRB93_007597 [Tulasnella sp. JGI-2019a]
MGVVYFVTTLAIANYISALLLPTIGWSPPLNLCFGVVPRSTSWAFVPPLMFECFLFSLTVARAIQHRRRDIAITEGVIGVLYRDGILYFLTISSCSFFNIIVWSALRPSLALLAKYFTFSFINVMASRIVLNLRSQQRDAARDDQIMQYASGSSSPTGLSSFSFAERLTAASLPTGTRQPYQYHHNFEPLAPGEQIALRGIGNREKRLDGQDLDCAHLIPLAGL